MYVYILAIHSSMREKEVTSNARAVQVAKDHHHHHHPTTTMTTVAAAAVARSVNVGKRVQGILTVWLP